MSKEKLIVSLWGLSVALGLASGVEAPVGFHPPSAWGLLAYASIVLFGIGLGILISNWNRI
jgi:hypothetical protein